MIQRTWNENRHVSRSKSLSSCFINGGQILIGWRKQSPSDRTWTMQYSISRQMDIWFCSDNDYKQNYLHSEMYSCINPSDDDPARHWLQHLPTTGRFLNRPPSCIFPIPTIYHYHILPSSMLLPKSKTLLHCTSHAMILMDCRIIFRFSTNK